MNVGTYIKRLRLDAGYSQEELGQLLGVQRAAVQKWESGKVQNLKRETIFRLAKLFAVPTASFFADDDNEEENGELHLLRPNEAQLIYAYRNNTELQAEINHMIRRSYTDQEIPKLADWRKKHLPGKTDE